MLFFAPTCDYKPYNSEHALHHCFPDPRAKLLADQFKIWKCPRWSVDGLKDILCSAAKEPRQRGTRRSRSRIARRLQVLLPTTSSM